MNSYIDRIIDTAKMKGISQAHLARKMGTYRTRLAECNNGKSTLNESEIEICAKELGVSSKWIISGKDTSPQSENKVETFKITEHEKRLALFGGDNEVTDEMWEEAQIMIELIKEKHKRKKEQGLDD